MCWCSLLNTSHPYALNRFSPALLWDATENKEQVLSDSKLNMFLKIGWHFWLRIFFIDWLTCSSRRSCSVSRRSFSIKGNEWASLRTLHISLALIRWILSSLFKCVWAAGILIALAYSRWNRINAVYKKVAVSQAIGGILWLAFPELDYTFSVYDQYRLWMCDVDRV